MVRLAGDDGFCACLDNRFDFLQRESAVASHENVTEAETLGAHRRIIYESENVMGRDVGCVVIRKSKAHESVRRVNFMADDLGPPFASANGIAHVHAMNGYESAIFGEHEHAPANARARASTRAAARA
jgi:hypothetical protein